MKFSSTSTARRRTVTIATAATLAVGLLAGCSSGSGDADPESDTVQWLTDAQDWTAKIEAVSPEIKDQTGVTVEPLTLPTTSNFIQTFLASLPTDKVSDVAKWTSGKYMQAAAATGDLEDLTPIWDAAVANGDLDDGLRPFFSHEGKVYGVPFTMSYWVMYYSKTLFEEAGISGPPTTWAELEDAAAKLKAIGAKTCTGQADGWTPFIPFEMFVGAKSPEVYNELIENEVSFDDPQIEDAMSVWKEWIDNGWMTAPDQKFSDCPAGMKAGNVGMFPIGTWYNSSFEAAGLAEGDVGAFVVPSMEEGGSPAVFSEASAWVVPKNAPNKEAALKAVAAWLTEPVQRIWSENNPDTSINPKIKSTDPIIMSIVEQVEEQQATKLIRYYEALPPKLVTSTVNSLGGFMVDPGSLEKTLSDMSTQAPPAWEQWEKSPSVG
ncbi:ABC transporter substrate-binding protein [Microbacterium sulfonylureivorans]|uniref:ABC transporter substrate-binding protein n=1 Tax=Microbacterium sulfonylureivorans TaxID=2486854 RepID=UPI0013DFB9D5|nr:ABC transporter substrate-binding protein [Microbacterium sulfonylureivorans]